MSPVRVGCRPPALSSSSIFRDPFFVFFRGSCAREPTAGSRAIFLASCHLAQRHGPLQASPSLLVLLYSCGGCHTSQQALSTKVEWSNDKAKGRIGGGGADPLAVAVMRNVCDNAGAGSHSRATLELKSCSSDSDTAQTPRKGFFSQNGQPSPKPPRLRRPLLCIRSKALRANEAIDSDISLIF